MCLALPAQVVAVDDTGATVEMELRLRRASTLMYPDIRVGEWVLVAAGTIVSRLHADEAAEIRDAVRAAMGLDRIADMTGGSDAVS